MNQLELNIIKEDCKRLEYAIAVSMKEEENFNTAMLLSEALTELRKAEIKINEIAK
jgi:hypothetical protein